MALISYFYCSYYLMFNYQVKTWWHKINRIHALTVWKSAAWHYLNFWVESTQVWGHIPTRGSKRRNNLSPNASFWIYKASLPSTWPFLIRTAIECFCFSSLWTSFFLSQKKKTFELHMLSILISRDNIFLFKVFL